MLDTSEDDWLLAIGCIDGSAYVQQLRQPIHLDGSDLSEILTDEPGRPFYLNYYPSALRLSVAGQRKQLLSAENGHPASVTFFPGGVLNSSLCMTRGDSHVRVWLSHPELRTIATLEKLAGPLDWIRSGDAVSVSLTRDGLLHLDDRDETSTRGNRARQVQLKKRSSTDFYVGVLYLEHHFEAPRIACLSREGRYVLTDSLLKVIEEVDLDLAGSRLRFYKLFNGFDAFGPVIETDSDLIVFHRGQCPTRIHARANARITVSQILADKVASRGVVVGYDDGVVEVHLESSSQYHYEQYFAHSGAVLDSRPLPCGSRAIQPPGIKRERKRQPTPYARAAVPFVRCPQHRQGSSTSTVEPCHNL